MIFASAISLLALSVASAFAATAGPGTRSSTNGKKNASKKQSSPKRDLNSIKVKTSRSQWKPEYKLKIMALRGLEFEILWVEKSPGTDGFIHHLTKEIDENQFMREEGLLQSVRRRQNSETDDIATNLRDGYPRKLIVRLVDQGSTPDTRRDILQQLADWLNRPDNNKFGYTYIVDDRSDLTPPEENHLEPMNHYIQDHAICNIIQSIYEQADDTWFENNPGVTSNFYGGPKYPMVAVEALGYPVGI